MDTISSGSYAVEHHRADGVVELQLHSDQLAFDILRHAVEPCSCTVLLGQEQRDDVQLALIYHGTDCVQHPPLLDVLHAVAAA